MSLDFCNSHDRCRSSPLLPILIHNIHISVPERAVAHNLAQISLGLGVGVAVAAAAVAVGAVASVMVAVASAVRIAWLRVLAAAGAVRRLVGAAVGVATVGRWLAAV